MELPKIDERFIKQYKELLICGLLLLLAVAFGIRQVVVTIMKIQETSKEHKKQKEKLNEAKKKLKDYEDANKRLRDKQSNIKKVFQPNTATEDSIASFGGMFEDIIDYVKINNLMLRSVQYQINPADDIIYGKFPTLYNVCNVQLMLVGTYVQLEGLVRDLTVYPYFINLSEVRINPYEKDDQYIIATINITLYSKKQQSAASVMGGDGAPGAAGGAPAGGGM